MLRIKAIANMKFEPYLHLRKGQNQMAEGLLFDAIDLDTNFAEACEFLAFLYWASGGVGQDAIAIDPNLLVADVFYKTRLC